LAGEVGWPAALFVALDLGGTGIAADGVSCGDVDTRQKTVGPVNADLGIQVAEHVPINILLAKRETRRMILLTCKS
jgi:hypothetical protein